jgi:hypothetical protein
MIIEFAKACGLFHEVLREERGICALAFLAV